MVFGVEAQEMRRRVTHARVARLATLREDGRPHLVPVCYALVGEVVYSAVDHKPKRTTALRRLANVAADARVCLLIDHYSDDWATLWWVRLDGTARVVTDEAEAAGAARALAARYRQYAERPPAGPVLAVDVTRWTGWSAL